ncbi:hypothetical protein SPONN_1390 [uncultured Candidatus Thioglobus sp.]|nr:hypothetical protein SPONN_1390 [uncultured Candidatus Thioglobus sp.]
MLENQAEYQELLQLFEKSETKIKHTEQITGEGILTPSINQLRYSGHHIVRALLGNGEHILDEIEKATAHAKRAIYDIDEALLLFYLEKIRNFKEKYQSNPFTLEVLPNYIQYLTDADTANNAIHKLPKDHQNRDQFYQQCTPHIIVRPLHKYE